jgi:hypothetical protein
VVAFIAYKIVNMVIGLRVSEGPTRGLDIARTAKRLRSGAVGERNPVRPARQGRSATTTRLPRVCAGFLPPHAAMLSTGTEQRTMNPIVELASGPLRCELSPALGASIAEACGWAIKQFCARRERWSSRLAGCYPLVPFFQSHRPCSAWVEWNQPSRWCFAPSRIPSMAWVGSDHGGYSGQLTCLP